ncbi:MAG: hypothetical protein ACT4SY_03735 [Hyphomicrobiales bacterium]
MDDGWQAGLWLAVIASGLYHGLSPGMGWPLAVAAGLSEKRGAGVFAALLPLAAGHFAAMAAVLLPFALLAMLTQHGSGIRIGAGLLVAGFGLYRLFDRRHPRALARIKPTQLALWSFLVAIAHGAGFLLVPVYLGLGAAAGETAHGGMHPPADNSLVSALVVSAVHTFAMIAAGGAIAWLVYKYLGLQFLKKSWFNLETVWAFSLIAAGAAGLGTALS